MATAEAAGVRIGDAGPKGLGAFAVKVFEEGDHVGDYEGEWLSLRDLDARYPHTAPKGADPVPPNLVDVAWRESRLRRGVGFSGDYIFGAGEDVFVDGEDVEASNWGRFINHGPETSSTCNLRCKTLAQVSLRVTWVYVTPPAVTFLTCWAKTNCCFSGHARQAKSLVCGNKGYFHRRGTSF